MPTDECGNSMSQNNVHKWIVDIKMIMDKKTCKYTYTNLWQTLKLTFAVDKKIH
jgi:hypothetical protein